MNGLHLLSRCDVTFFAVNCHNSLSPTVFHMALVEKLQVSECQLLSYVTHRHVG